MTPWEEDTAFVRATVVQLVAADPATVRVMVHEGVPVAWQRTGGATGRRFTPHKLRHAERDLAACLRAAVPDKPWLSNVALVARFYLYDRLHRDADNLLKTVMDAGNEAGIWKDDCQVTTALAFVELDYERPRTVVALCPTTSSLDRTVGMKHPTRSAVLKAKAAARAFSAPEMPPTWAGHPMTWGDEG